MGVSRPLRRLIPPRTPNANRPSQEEEPVPAAIETPALVEEPIVGDEPKLAELIEDGDIILSTPEEIENFVLHDIEPTSDLMAKSKPTLLVMAQQAGCSIPRNATKRELVRMIEEANDAQP